jgi:transcriptional regulator with XRE-family HTH domain
VAHDAGMVRPRRPSAIHEPEYQYLIRRLREARIEAGMTLADVGNALERPLTFVSKCELGERRIDPIDLKRFAELYEKPLEYFYPQRSRRGGKNLGNDPERRRKS